MLSVGAPAPSFMAKTHKGMTANMNLQPAGSLTANGHFSVLLWFYPRASTDGCTAEGKKFEELLDAYKAKMCRVVGVSNDGVAENCAFASSCSFRYPLICDESLAISIAYGAAKDASAASASRMAVLIDREGNVAKVWASVDPKTFPETALKELPEPGSRIIDEDYKKRNSHLGAKITQDELDWRAGYPILPDSVIAELPPGLTKDGFYDPNWVPPTSKAPILIQAGGK